jgi:hypothetical protein
MIIDDGYKDCLDANFDIKIGKLGGI